jgi:Polyketide cyclase / dehydrase and lipid transport
MNGVNEHAPVVGASVIEIGVTPEVVWEVLTAFERWPDWNPDVKSMSMRHVAPDSTAERPAALSDATQGDKSDSTRGDNHGAQR